MKPLLIYGSGEFGITVKLLAQRCEREVTGFVDDFNQGPGIVGNFETASQRYPAETHDFAMAIGYRHMQSRWIVLGNLFSKGYQLPPLVHPRAIVESSKIGMGTIIMAGAMVDERSQIAELCVLWNGANVSHHCHIGDGCFLAPSVTICGFTTVGSQSFLGANATITERVEIEPDRFVKAGSLVTPANSKILPVFDAAKMP